MKKGENEYTYPPYEQVQAQELLDNLRKIAPFVVADCGSYIANDILSAVALMAHRCVDARWNAVRQPDRQPDHQGKFVAGLARWP